MSQTEFNIIDYNSLKKYTFVSDYIEKSYMPSVESYNNLVLNSSGDNEQFLFFTDSHLANSTNGVINKAYDDINLLNAIYNASSASFMIDGGNWLNSGDTLDSAVSKLTFIDGAMNKKFKHYYPVNGDHDTNYFGEERIDNAHLIQLRRQYRKEKHLYYHFSGTNSSWYVFDTGIENEAIGDYQNEQLLWFANSLLNERSQHIVLVAHILNYSDSSIQPLIESVLAIAAGYNAKEVVTVDERNFDYVSADGKVSFLIAGHSHKDWDGVINTIPCILTADAQKENTLTFDLCLADLENKKLYTKRVGSGSDRIITIL